MSKIFIFISLTFVSFLGISQKNFEGIITYTIEYNKVPKEMLKMTSQLPKELVVKYLDSKKREEAISNQSSKITITDFSTNKSFVLMTLFGEKIALIQDDENKKESDLYANCEIKITNETKKIGKFKCQQALLIFPQIKEPSKVYFTNKYTTLDKKYSKLNGFPLEYSTMENGMLITYTMVKIEEKSLKPKEFEVDGKYTIITPEQLQKQFGME